MTFTELLNDIIKESGLTNKEIIARCKEVGEPITANYLSILKNDSSKIPSEKVAITLAKVCNARYENILVVQAYLDRAPDIIKEFLTIIYQQNIEEAKEIARKLSNEENIKALEKMNMAEFICDYLEEWHKNPTSFTVEINKLQKLLSVIEQEGKDYALIKISPDTPIKYLSSEEIAEKKL